MAKKKKPQPVEEVFHVEVVTKARVSDDCEWEYFVKWAGYDSEDNSWEPSVNLKQCDRLLGSFWRHVGLDNEDYPVGYQISANADWIKNEKEYFATQYDTEDVERRDGKNKEKERKKRSRARKPSATTEESSKSIGKGKRRSLSSQHIVSSDSGDVPLRVKIGGTKRKAITSDSEANSSDSQPLHRTLRTDVSPNSAPQKEMQGTMQEGPGPSVQPSTTLFSPRSSPDIAVSTRQHLGPTIAKPSGFPVPQKTRKKRKVVELTQPKFSPGSTLATKQRISLSAIIPIKAQRSDPQISKPNPALAKMNFKKTPAALTDLADIQKGPVGLGSPNPSHDEHDPSGDISEAESNAFPGLFSEELDTPVDDFQALMETGTFPADDFSEPPHLAVSPVVRSSITLDDNIVRAEHFLQSILPASSVPLAETPADDDSIDGPPPPVSLSFSNRSIMPRIPKKWKWSGELFLDVAQGKSVRLCEIMITDTTDHLPEGLRFSILLSSMDSIRFGKTYDVSDINMILPSCGKVQQIGKLGPLEEKGNETFAKLLKYMNSRQRVTFVPLLLDNASVAVMLVFSSGMLKLCNRFKVPQDLRDGGAFVTILLPWAMGPIAYEKLDWHRHCDIIPTFPADPADGLPQFDPKRRHRSLRANPMHHRALHVLKFPQWLFEWMPRRSYCIWRLPADGNVKCPGQETKMLRTILDNCGARYLGHKGDVRVVFVHVGAIRTLHQLPDLVERRSKHFEISFYTFGTHESVVPESWGIYEIFPVGGIVTFTPNAFLEDPLGTFRLIKKLAEHELWACYTTPSVVGRVADVACSADALVMFDKGEFLFDYILNSINDGFMSLSQAPPLSRNASIKDDSVNRWIDWQLRMAGLDSRGLLEECVKSSSERYSKIPKSEVPSAIEKDIIKDFLDMQTQPAIMKRYRRFVIIKGANEDHIESDRNGFEWIPASKFCFKDDFFGKIHNEKL